MHTDYKDKSEEEMDLILSNFQVLTLESKRNLWRFLADLSLIHISEPTRRVVISYAVFCLTKKK